MMLIADGHIRQPITGIVLAGGKSTRLGQDKAVIRFMGQTLLERAISLVSQLSERVIVVGRDPSIHGLETEWLPDDITGRGPAAGIMTALRYTQGAVLVISCDLPFLNEKILSKLLAERVHIRRHECMTTYCQVETGFIESLVAVYEYSALPLLEDAVGKNLNKISRIIPEFRRRHIMYSKDEAMPFFNINYPADLAVMQKLEGVS
ncbi:molybdenum cofactor guanylyltransferase [Desulfovibrio inopinatus]|uniref:molybdenum cofactor guanylyltransferase n=1 Tax=Desulfovibrio inopinatus TaxID=102109 RepID=UPI000420EDB8|nr:molybdenum cofactor guanylyltransferase [Desulfovibrio inopinatus]